MAIDILQISKTALEAQKTNPDVINASIGMFLMKQDILEVCLQCQKL